MTKTCPNPAFVGLSLYGGERGHTVNKVEYNLLMVISAVEKKQERRIGC